VAEYRFVVDIDAPREQVFALWTNLDRMAEWIGGMKDVVERNGSIDEVGSTYVVRFGSWAKSPTTVIASERPSRFATRFGNTYLRGENDATFDDVHGRTRLTQVFRVQGLVPRLMARVWATGSYRGTFRGELNEFKRICEREAAAGR
jgi:uncharacterized protein YndB with AHSA1/START domain